MKWQVLPSPCGGYIIQRGSEQWRGIYYSRMWAAAVCESLNNSLTVFQQEGVAA